MMIVSSKKICVLYHFYEANQNYVKNFQHFLTFGISNTADYFCIIAGNCSVEPLRLPNVTYIVTENKNWDYGGYAKALKNHVPIDAYEYFAFINSSVRGPFISPLSDTSWLDSFIPHFTEDIGAVGCAINILSPQSIDSLAFKKEYPQLSPPYSHVQTTAYMLSKRALSILFNYQFFDIRDPLAKNQVICRYELLLSQLLIHSGLNIKCLLPEYNQIDYRKTHADINPTSHLGDPSVPDGYFGRTIHPYEGMFVKTQRNLYPEHYLDLLTRSMLAQQKPINNFLHLASEEEILRSKYLWESQEQWKTIFKKLRKSIKRYWRT